MTENAKRGIVLRRFSKVSDERLETKGGRSRSNGSTIYSGTFLLTFCRQQVPSNFWTNLITIEIIHEEEGR